MVIGGRRVFIVIMVGFIVTKMEYSTRGTLRKRLKRSKSTWTPLVGVGATMTGSTEGVDGERCGRDRRNRVGHGRDTLDVGDDDVEGEEKRKRGEGVKRQRQGIAFDLML